MAITLSSVPRSIQLQVLTGIPTTVRRDGNALQKFSSQAMFDAGGDGWIAGPQAGFVSIKFHHTGGTSTVQF